MKLEEAKELYSAGNPGPSSPRFKAWVAAENFLDGHASRDPEVAAKDLKIRAMEAEAATCTRHDWHKALLAEREASRKLVEAAKKTPMPCLKAHQLPRYKSCRDIKNWNTHQEFYCHNCRFLEALEVYAAPGHSPEGKNVA